MLQPSIARTEQDLERILWSSIDLGINDYFADCHKRVEPFVKQHFMYPGAYRLNRLALGWDLLKAPLNLFWAPFYLLFMALAWLVRKLGMPKVYAKLQRLPSGFSTQVQRYLESHCYQELLQRPLNNQERDGLREAIEQRLRQALSTGDYHDVNRRVEQQVQPLLDEAMSHYNISRTATADIGNSMLSMVIGVFAFQKYAPGGIALGIYGSVWLAKYLAIDDFWAGPWLGQLYYTVFDASPSLVVSMMSVAASLMFLAVVACFSGLVLDPLQARLGIHQWRLKRMLNQLEKDVKRKSKSSFRPKEPYIARILDILDLARTHLG